MSKLLEHSEQITGLILNGKQTSSGFNPDKFAVPYQPVIRDIKAGKTREELFSKYTNLIQSAQHAANSVNGLGTDLDYIALLDNSYRMELVEQETQKALRYLQNGQIDKYDDSIRRITATRQSVQRLSSVPADEISDAYIPLMGSGSLAWDKQIGGIPTVGTVILGAKTYTGKTTLAIRVMKNFLKKYPERDILFVTLEDMNEGWKYMAKRIIGNEDKEFWHRIKVMEFSNGSSGVIEEASRYEKIGMIMVDYIDYLATSKDLSSYEEIHKSFSMGAKSLAVVSKFRSMPIFLLCQFGKTLYKGGVPTLNALPYAGETYASQICMLYHSDGDFYADSGENAYTLPSEKDTGFLIFWKVKHARPHKDAGEFPGAIKVRWSGSQGFDIDRVGEWCSLASETKREVAKRK